MNAYRSRKTGFTLVEILIVVVILGILAAIVIPQFADASESARRNSLTSQLQTIRSQIELYKVQHHDALPDITTNWDVLTKRTDDQGVPSSSGLFGPYLQSVPTNSMNTATAVFNGDGSGAATGPSAFIYDYGTTVAPGTGKIWGTGTDGAQIFVENAN